MPGVSSAEESHSHYCSKLSGKDTAGVGGLLPSPPSQAFTTSLIKAESEEEKEEAKVTTGIMEPLIVMIIQL